jgi:hypothetical protein
MKVLIENYRGYDIDFDRNYEVFQSIITDGVEKESKSFSAIKRFIDDHLKENANFKPFYVVTSPESRMYYGDVKIKIIGIRKDGNFVYEDLNGDKKQISKHDEDRYMLENKNNEEPLRLLSENDSNRINFLKENSAIEKELISKLVVKTLNIYKKEMLGN